MSKIRIAIVGYGNLGRGVEMAVARNDDMQLAGIFTRRNPSEVQNATPGVPVGTMDDLMNQRDLIDVVILCGGSATDLPKQTPEMAKHFTVIDSFDTHAKIPIHFANVDASCKAAGTVGIISVGWDPGLFSLNRIYAESVLCHGSTYTFWGKGVSQGHSDAIRRVKGVKYGIQYTVPVESALEAVRNCENPALTTRQKHTRECYIVTEEGADRAAIEAEIVNMPNYFADYDTTVTFMQEADFLAVHNQMPHGGFVLRSGVTGNGTNQMIEYSLKLGSNPEFTASVLTAYARAAYRLVQEGVTGAKTVFDIAPSYLSLLSPEEQRAQLL